VLLLEAESEWLDWKADFSPGLLGGKRHELWNEGRGKVLRALQVIANSVYGQCGYLVYGVDNSKRPREITGISKSFDDADFQDWSSAAIRPRIDFHYREEIHEGKTVGIFEIRPSSQWPHVCEQPIAEILADGQVWIRRGSRCSLAHYEELHRMFEPQEPLEVQSHNGPVVDEIRRAYGEDGWEPHWPSRSEKADRLAAGDRMAYLPGSRREIHFANHVLLLRRKGTG
jgi:hypothetical protein